MTAPQRPTPRTDARENEAADVTSYCLDGWAFARSLERSLSEREEECEKMRADAQVVAALRASSSEADQRDAARYRWLRDIENGEAAYEQFIHFAEEELDAAIDLNLRSSGTGGQVPLTCGSCKTRHWPHQACPTDKEESK